MGLPKRAYTGNVSETEVLINVFCLKEKGKILFTGNGREVSNYVGIRVESLITYLKYKVRCKKKYALRYAKQP